MTENITLHIHSAYCIPLRPIKKLPTDTETDGSNKLKGTGQNDWLIGNHINFTDRIFCTKSPLGLLLRSLVKYCNKIHILMLNHDNKFDQKINFECILYSNIHVSDPNPLLSLTFTGLGSPAVRRFKFTESSKKV